MRPITRSEAREIDRIATEELRIPGIVLMENAGIGIARIAREMLGEGAGTVCVYCGPGSNGGDGFAAARHLHNAGIRVVLRVIAPEAAYRPGSDPAVQHAIVRAMGLELRHDADGEPGELAIDALFGVGLSREVEEPYRAAILAMNRGSAPVLAVDIPSGLDADSGRLLGVGVRATVTASMAAPKRGLFLGSGPAHAGAVRVVELGIPPERIARVAAD